MAPAGREATAVRLVVSARVVSGHGAVQAVDLPIKHVAVAPVVPRRRKSGRSLARAASSSSSSSASLSTAGATAPQPRAKNAELETEAAAAEAEAAAAEAEAEAEAAADADGVWASFAEATCLPQAFMDASRDFETKRPELVRTLRARLPKDVEISYPGDDPAGRKHYTGSVRHGRPHGRGSLTWACGSRYDGEFKNDKLTGTGVYTWSSGKRYTGRWQDGKANGYGTLSSGTTTEDDVMEYRGMWRDGLMHGFGKLRLENGDVFEGSWEYNNKHGVGTYLWVNGERYDGSFDNHFMHGRGVYRWPNGRALELLFDRHVAAECWDLSYAMWLLMTFVSVEYVMQIVVYGDAPSASASHLFGLDVFFARSLMMPFVVLHAMVFGWEAEGFFAVPAPEMDAAVAAAMSASMTAAGAAAPVGMTEWALTMLLKEMALPHVRVLLLCSLQSSLREMFANLIFNVACWTCHYGSRTLIDDETCWSLGLLAGCIHVCIFASLHMVLYHFVF